MRDRLKNDKKLRIKLILAGIIFLLLLGASVFTVFIRPRINTETYVYKEETVKRGDLVLGIMESGSLSLGECSVKYDLDLSYGEDDEEDNEDEESGNTKYLEIEEVYAVSGQRIAEGDKLFKFTDKSVSVLRRKMNAALAEAQISLSEAQTDYHISELSAKSVYDSSVTAGNRAETDYKAAMSKSTQTIRSLEGEISLLELEIAQAQEKLADEDFLNSINEAQIAYSNAKNKYDETDVHNTTAYVSNLNTYQNKKEALESLQKQRQGYQDTITENQAEIEKRQQKIEAAKASQALNEQEAENEYNSAKMEGELAEEIYRYSMDSLADAVNQAQTKLDEMKDQVEAFETFVGSDNTIYAAEAGLVVNVFYEAGDTLEQAGTMLAYSREEDCTVSIDVSEEDIAAVSVGSSVDIVFSAYPDKTFRGTIQSITTTAASDYAATVSYPVKIAVEGDTSLLYGGMTADVTFVTDSVSDVLYVSKKAVFEEGGKTYVYRQAASGKMEAEEVETGFADMTSIEIKSGLREGDVVYIKSIMSTAGENSRSKESSSGDPADAGREEIPSDDFPFGPGGPDQNGQGGWNGPTGIEGNFDGMPGGGGFPPGGFGESDNNFPKGRRNE